MCIRDSYRILNKLTPDNFEKLSFELARHAGINNKEILKGAILLVSFTCSINFKVQNTVIEHENVVDSNYKEYFGH